MPSTCVACLELLDDIRLAGHGKQRRQPFLVGDDTAEHLARFKLAWPAYEAGHAEGALPVGVLFTAPGRDGPIRPGIVMRAVVGRVLDDGVVGDAQLVQQVEQLADRPVVQHHGVVVEALAADALRLFGNMGEEVHVGGVPPHEERFAIRMGLLDELDRAGGDIVIDGLHALSGQRAGVLDGLLAHPAKARVFGRIIDIRRFAMEQTPRPKELLELRLLGIIGNLRLLLGVEVVQVAVELVKAMNGGQEYVAVAEVVLAKLPGDIAVRLEQLGNGRVFRLQADAALQDIPPWSARCGPGSGR